MTKQKLIITLFIVMVFMLYSNERIKISAIGIPLADHYAGIVAYEKYRDEMKYADYSIKLLTSPDLIRRYFRYEDNVDIAFNVSPMVLDMYKNKSNFKIVSLLHRDGVSFTINNIVKNEINLKEKKSERSVDEQIPDRLNIIKEKYSKPLEIGIPSILATHSVILYKYLRDYNIDIGFKRNLSVRENFERIEREKNVKIVIVKPPKSPVYLNSKTSRNRPAAFIQSYPWPEIAEEKDYGKIVWSSKDILTHPNGHVECVMIAKKDSIKNKQKALKEVIYYIHKAGSDIEKARHLGKLDEIAEMINKYIPIHSKKSIIESLNEDTHFVNYNNLNIDQNSKDSLNEIMKLAVEARYLKYSVNLDEVMTDIFNTSITIGGE